MSAACAVDIGQTKDEAFDVHALFDTVFENVRLVELLSGLKLVAVETDEDIAVGGLFTIGAAALNPKGTITTEFGREAELHPALGFVGIAAVGGFTIGTGEGEAIVREGEVAWVEALGALVVVGDQGDDLSLAVGELGDDSPGFAVTVSHIGSESVASREARRGVLR